MRQTMLRQVAKIIALGIIAAELILAAGLWYVSIMRDTFWNQSVDTVMEITGQAVHALEVHIRKEMEILHFLTSNLARRVSSDHGIEGALTLFDHGQTHWRLVLLADGQMFSTRSGEQITLSPEELGRYRALHGSGILAPHMDEITGVSTSSVYARFAFVDGVDALLLRTRPAADFSEEFSPHFYGGHGFSYVVEDTTGEILMRSRHPGTHQTSTSLFNAIRNNGGNSEEAFAAFRKSLHADERGAVLFHLGAEEYLLTYAPIRQTPGWTLVGVVPYNTIREHTDDVLHSSQIFVLMVGVTILLSVLFWGSYRSIREKETELRYREQLFGILANNTDDVFILMDVSTFAVEYVSPNVERVLGIKPQDLRRNPDILGDVIESDHDQVELRDLRDMAVGSSFTRESERIHQVSQEHKNFLETVYHVAIDESDKFILILSDRTLDRRSRRMLEEALSVAHIANESKSTFLSNMSHDIRTPINAIIGLTTLIKRDAARPERVAEHAGKLMASSQHLLGLINDILDMSKIESGKTSLSIAEISLPELLREVETIIRPQAEAKHQSFRLSIRNLRAETLLGDSLRLNQIFINILSNAIKYTHVGGRVEMIVQQLPHDTPSFARLRFIFRDNGIGMSPEFLETIFTPFTRESTAITVKTQGTGLGMAITKNLIDLMGGTISVESEEGLGSCFTVELQLQIPESESDVVFWKSHGIARLLVVDDEEDVCASIADLMDGSGVEVLTCLDVRHGVELAKQAHEEGRDFDLVLLDWVVPDPSDPDGPPVDLIDGLSAARLMRQALPETSALVALTFCDEGTHKAEAHAAGVNACLPKPFFLSSLRRVVEQLRQSEQGGERTSVPILRGRHVLVVEDNSLNAEIIAELLDMLGISCDLAANGAEGFHDFEDSEIDRYDAILMDVQMPVMDGYEATRAIRACHHPRALTIPVVAMTANAFSEDVKRALDSGMDAHVAKPVDIQHLAEVLTNLLAAERETREAAGKTAGPEAGEAAEAAPEAPGSADKIADNPAD